MDLTSFFDQPDNGPLNIGLNRSVAHYIMAAYAYYVEDDPIYSDEQFDGLAKYLLKNFDNITHPHKSYLSKDMLEAGTYIGQYPSMAIGGLEAFREYEKKSRKTSSKSL